ncbi:MAG: DUF4239 domain-containing protein [Pirellulales bacterium]|nr:DUF4239 domain-containing protein [Pirellulales bacterium]
MDIAYTVLLVAIGLFLGMLLLLICGRRIGIWRMAQDPEGARVGMGAIDGAIFALLGLLIAFTFSGAAGRFDARRQLIVEEANVIGTAYLRIDLLPPEEQPALRQSFREYMDSRLEVLRKLPDIEAAQAEAEKALTKVNAIWPRAVSACKASENPTASMLLLPAINQMIDIATTSKMAALLHPPTVIFVMLAVLALVSSLLAGYGMAGGKKHSWMHIVGFALVMAITIYVILDIEYPRLGLIHIESFDQAFIDLRASMK